MANPTKNTDTITRESLIKINASEPSLTLGILGNYADDSETRILLTPEACGLLTSVGINICLETGAGNDISFPDETYAEFDVKIVSRAQALSSPIVLSYTPLKPKDIKKMKPGSTLLCMMNTSLFDPDCIQALLNNKITCGCFDNMISQNDELVFANIIDEIDGRAAIMYAEDALSYLGGGKGVLLGGVAGLNPCEIILFGASNDIIAAANAGAAVGARVTLMDNDISILQAARPKLDTRVETIAIHPRVLFNKLKSADVIIQGTTTYEFEIPQNLLPLLKENVYILNMIESHPSESVPRTVAMALSNALVNFIDEMAINNGFHSMIKTNTGVQTGIVTYDGCLVDKLIGSCLGMPAVDINVMLSASN